MLYDSQEKTVRIPVIVMNGNIRYFYGGNLPAINNGAIGDLIIPEYTVKDKRFVKISQWEEVKEIIPADSTIMVGVASKYIPTDKCKYVYELNYPQPTGDLYIRVKLLEPLQLQVRGSKKSNLLGVKCKIPDLDNFEATSINNAYTKISEEFEPNRKSHTGNVFEKCFYKGNDDKWYPLDWLRVEIEGKFEENLFLDYKIYKLNTDKFNMQQVDENEMLILGYIKQHGKITGKKVKELYNDDKEKYINIINELLYKDFIIELNE